MRTAFPIRKCTARPTWRRPSSLHGHSTGACPLITVTTGFMQSRMNTSGGDSCPVIQSVSIAGHSTVCEVKAGTRVLAARLIPVRLGRHVCMCADRHADPQALGGRGVHQPSGERGPPQGYSRGRPDRRDARSESSYTNGGASQCSTAPGCAVIAPLHRNWPLRLACTPFKHNTIPVGPARGCHSKQNDGRATNANPICAGR